jgi:branched-subunit amino acid transport protein
MNHPWELGALLAVVTATTKAAGPVALGGRPLPGWFSAIVRFMAPALLSALVCISAFSHGHQLGLGANTVGVGVAGAAMLRGAPVITAVIVAVIVTSLLRAI